MRPPSVFSEMRLRSSLFLTTPVLTTPAKKPRTECCCQSVAFMIAAIVVPLGSCSIFSTTDCLDDEDAGDFAEATFEAATREAALDFGRVVTLLFAGAVLIADQLHCVFC